MLHFVIATNSKDHDLIHLQKNYPTHCSMLSRMLISAKLIHALILIIVKSNSMVSIIVRDNSLVSMLVQNNLMVLMIVRDNSMVSIVVKDNSIVTLQYQ